MWVIVTRRSRAVDSITLFFINRNKNNNYVDIFVNLAHSATICALEIHGSATPPLRAIMVLGGNDIILEEECREIFQDDGNTMYTS